MVLTKNELVATLQHEVRILLHLAGKIDRKQIDYRPSPKQRSTLELLRYLSNMGPMLVEAALGSGFDMDKWTAATEAANARDFDATVAAIAKHSDAYATMLADVPEAKFREEIELFGNKSSRGAFIVYFVLGGCAAYRTQLFLYLKACGREELTTANLWGGADAPATV